MFAVPGKKKCKGVGIRRKLSQYLMLYGFVHNMPKKYGLYVKARTGPTLGPHP